MKNKKLLLLIVLGLHVSLFAQQATLSEAINAAINY